MIGESILELHETNAIDESIKFYEYDEYQQITGTQLNSAGQITITIENLYQFLHLHNSYLLIEGDVLKADDTRYADADRIALVNNGLLHVFSSLKLTLAGQEVEHVNYPGQATPLLGLACYSTTYSKGCGLARECEAFAVPESRHTVWRLGISSAPEKPRWILVGLQTDKSGNQECNAALFDHCNLTNMQVWLNHSRYPSLDMTTDFPKEQFASVIGHVISLMLHLYLEGIITRSLLSM